MRAIDDELLSWVITLAHRTTYNLTSSGLFEPDLSAMGLNTSFDDFAAEKDEHERLFVEEVARLHGTEPANVVLTSGASEAIFMVYSILGAGRRAVIPLPNYGPMFNVPRSLEMEVSHSLGSSPTSRRCIYGLTDPNNPTGRTLDGQAVEDLARASERRGNTLFINETYKEFAFGRPPNTLFGLHDNIVVSGTMTKFYGLGRLRVGWVLADRKRAKDLWRAKRLISGHDSEYSLWLARQVLKKRQKFLERARRIYSENVRLVNKFVRETRSIHTVIGVTPFCLISYAKGPGSVTLAKRLLAKAGVLVSPGDFFGAPKSFRLCFTPDRRRLGAGLRKLSDFLTSSIQ